MNPKITPQNANAFGAVSSLIPAASHAIKMAAAKADALKTGEKQIAAYTDVIKESRGFAQKMVDTHFDKAKDEIKKH